MSTRGATGFVANGKWYVTYNHSDSYPEFLGMHVLQFCKAVTDWEYLKSMVEKVILVDEDNAPSQELINRYSIYGNISVSKGELQDWYCLLRCLQGEKILYEIALGRVEHMIDDHIFLANSLSCQWAYIVDLDNLTLNVYKGRNEKSIPDTPLPPDIDPTKNGFDRWGKEYGDEFYPVRMLYAYDLSKLPEFILGVTNEFKKDYRERHKAVNIEPSWENFY